MKRVVASGGSGGLNCHADIVQPQGPKSRQGLTDSDVRDFVQRLNGMYRYRVRYFDDVLPRPNLL
jgi:hypothetical protein